MTEKSRRFLPYGRQSIDESDIAAVREALESDYLTTGPRVDAFEAALSDRVGARGAVACSSGTTGLHLAMAAVGLVPGDVVIVPSITFVATANAAIWCGGRVVFSDVDPDTGLMTAAALAEALARADGPVKVVAPVHLAGQSVDMPEIEAVAHAAGARIVEDACHALGTIAEDGAIGGCARSDATVFSFHPVKTATAGEGGAVTARDESVLDRLRLLRNHGLVRDPARFSQRDLAFAADGSPNGWYYELQEVGFNYRLTDVACALAASQLRRLDRFVSRRAELVALYDERLAPLAPRIRPMPRRPGQSPAWHLSVVLVDFDECGVDRETMMRRLRARGIGSQVHYIPVHLQPWYRRTAPTPLLPGAEAYYRRALSLPLFPDMEDGDVDRVVDALDDAIRP